MHLPALSPSSERDMHDNKPEYEPSLTCFCRIIMPLGYLVLLRLRFYQKEDLCHELIGMPALFCFLKFKGYFLQYFKCFSVAKKDLLHNIEILTHLKYRKLLMSSNLHTHKLNSCTRHLPHPSLYSG